MAFRKPWVFGSMARGDAGAGSGVDLLVRLPEGGSRLAIGGLQIDAQDRVGRHVNWLPQLRQRLAH